MSIKILVAVDLSKFSEALVQYGHELAHRLNVQVDFIHVLPHASLFRGYEPWLPPEVGVEVREIAQKKISYWLRKAEEVNPRPSEHQHRIIVEAGVPSDTVISQAKSGGYNLIVVGHQGHSALEDLFVGSTTTSIARHAHCSVLIFRPGLEAL